MVGMEVGTNAACALSSRRPPAPQCALHTTTTGLASLALTSIQTAKLAQAQQFVRLVLPVSRSILEITPFAWIRPVTFLDAFLALTHQPAAPVTLAIRSPVAGQLVGPLVVQSVTVSIVTGQSVEPARAVTQRAVTR